MTQKTKKIMSIIVAVVLLFPTFAYAWEGDCGYEGGISSQQKIPTTKVTSLTYDYKEVSFITGKPIVLSGTLNITKALKQNIITATYDYNLKNTDEGATLKRTHALDTKQTNKDNGQIIEETSFNKLPTESIVVGGNTYSLKSHSYTRTSLIDPRPAINYYAGSISAEKVYQVGTGATTTTAATLVKVSTTGNFYGYDQFWGSTEAQTLNYVVEYYKGSVNEWGGSASVNLSATSSKQLRYVKNTPDQISFEGGFIQTQESNSVMEYSARFPEFDAKNVATDRILSYNDSLKLETSPEEKYLISPKTQHLRGHWAENDINTLFSLEVFIGNEGTFDPEQFMTRGDFIAAFVTAAKKVPTDPALALKTTTTTSTTSNKKTTPTSPFTDVDTKTPLFEKINESYQRGIIYGRMDNNFYPYENINLADALCIITRSLGLEKMAPSPNAVTSFKDNDTIPSYARNAAIVAQEIGLIQGDERGYLNPNMYLTKARGSALINRYIGYLRDGIKKDYRENIINY